MRGSTLALAGLLGLLSAAPAAAQETSDAWSAARYHAALFDDGTQAWHYGSIEAGVHRPRVTPIARVNWASRFGREAIQLEADLYPTWPGVGYAYLSAAWGMDLPFPGLRLAGEAYVSLPAAYEVSAGLIYMEFDAADAMVLVGSVGKYIGSYWISMRPSVETESGNLAVTLITRRYLDAADEFISLRLLAGSTPEEIERRSGSAAAIGTIGIQTDGQFEIAPRWQLLPLAGVISDERPTGDRRLRISLGLGAMYRF